tara:strand:- start:9107 stop:10531 length:1425 start_codon:yes stop_codon:yes gene_type:complete
MYSTREALAYTGKLPMQQAAITPQLLDLLAMQKVEADKKAAAQQLAMASGQPQPTIAQGLQQRAMQSARQEIAQKMGLSGLAQAQPPAGTMPQQAPQGLESAPTNLPTEYRGGGIIAFATGGSGGDAHGRYRQNDQTDDQSVDQTDDQSVDEYAISPSGGDAHGRYRQDAATQDTQAPNENVKFNDVIQAAILRGINQDPEALGREEIKTQQEMLSPSREAAIAHKREQQAGLKALYERQIAERPSGLRVALDRMAQNIREPGGFGAAMQGVSQAGQAAREGYTKQEITQLNTLSAIDDEIDKAIENNDVSKYNAYVARKKEVRGEMKDALTSGTSLANVLESMQGRKQMAADRIEEARRSKMADDARKRELASAELARKYETDKRLGQEFTLKMAEIRAGKENALGSRQDKLELDAREKAMKAVYGDLKLMNASPEDRETAIDQLTAVLLKKKGDVPAPTTRLKFDAQGNQIK